MKFLLSFVILVIFVQAIYAFDYWKTGAIIGAFNVTTDENGYAPYTPIGNTFSTCQGYSHCVQTINNTWTNTAGFVAVMPVIASSMETSLIFKRNTPPLPLVDNDLRKQFLYTVNEITLKKNPWVNGGTFLTISWNCTGTYNDFIANFNSVDTCMDTTDCMYSILKAAWSMNTPFPLVLFAPIL